MSKLIIPNKDIVIPGADASSRLLREDFETIERYLQQNAGAGVDSLNGIKGAVDLIAGSGVVLSESGQDITISASGQRARAFSAFSPGVLQSRTLQVYQVDDGVLTRLDAFCLTAPAGVTGASCGNVRVRGTTSGSLTLPLNVAGQSEYHLAGTSGSTAAQTAQSGQLFLQGGPANAWSVGGATFVPTANISVGGFDIAISAPWNSPFITPFDATDWVRVGMMATPISGNAYPGGPALTWLTDTAGNPCFIDISAGSMPNTQFPAFDTVASFDAPVDLVAGTSYTLMITTLNNAKNAQGVTTLSWNASAGPFTFTGNTSSVGAGVMLITLGAAPTWSFSSGHNFVWSVVGNATGVVLVGPVIVDTTLSGAPANPGSDINISLQM